MTKLLDFESRSRCDLKKRGGRCYWEDPSTEALCCVLYDTERNEVTVWEPGDPCPVNDDDELAAHNAMGFDRFGAARLGWRSLDHRTPWVDTSELARRAGLPGALDALGTRWLGIRKDTVGSKYTKSLSAPSRAKKTLGQLKPITREVLDRVIPYCMGDVEIMAHGWEELRGWLEYEPEVSRVDRIVNDRGVQFDSQLARRLLQEDAYNAELALEATAKNIGGEWTAAKVRDVASSPQQFTFWTGLENAKAETLELVLADKANEKLHPEVWALCMARQAIASIARGKLEAGLARVSPDGRLRDSHRYIGAHTWRWSGRGMQLQNMPRPDKRFEKWTDDDICRLADAVLGGAHCTQDEIDLLLRATIIGREGHGLIVCDFSGVEARGNAWCAGDEEAVQLFREGVLDAYKVMASVIFGVPYDQVTKEMRQVGKVAELACGYGMGAAKFGVTALKAGANLEAMGISPKGVIAAWRKKHAPIKEFWYALQNAFERAARGETSWVDCFEFCPNDAGDVAMFLPSGRPIVYPKVELSYEGRRAQLSYEGQHDAREKDPVTGKPVGEPKPMRDRLYGGLICENAIQALCRDLMADALVRSEVAGLSPVLHIHDEIVCEVPRGSMAAAYKELEHIMLTLPKWADGFPMGAAGHFGVRYRK
jgi:DNA polymerase